MMGYVLDADGKVTFTCRGCAKQVVTRSLKAIPKGWCISGILGQIPDPESLPPEAEASTQQEALTYIAASLSDHFCSERCAKRHLSTREVQDRVRRLGVVLVLWGKCTLVIDGSRAPGEKVDPALFGKKHIDEEGEERPGSPPPYKADGPSPI